MPYTFADAEFDGFERGSVTCSIERRINWVDSIGGQRRGVPYATEQFDEWVISGEIWLDAARAQILEAKMPPYGTEFSSNYANLPKFPDIGNPDAEAVYFPGIRGYDTGDSALYGDVLVRHIESLGRKAPRVDLFGYSVEFALCLTGNANKATNPTTTPPAWLGSKFSARQLQDWSNVERMIYNIYGPNPYAPNVQHGRRFDINIQLDHLTDKMCDEIVAFFRGIRHRSANVTIDNGPNGTQTIPMYFEKLSFQRGAGLWWDGTLEGGIAS